MAAAEPAANHAAAGNLLKLAVLLDEPAYATRAEAVLRAGARAAETQPFAVPVLRGALDLFRRGVIKVEVRGEPDVELAAALRRTCLPRAVWTRSAGGGGVVVCERQVCRVPVKTVKEWEKLVAAVCDRR